MRRWLGHVLVLVLIAGLAAACSDDNSSLTPTGPTTPPTVRSETFSGVLTKNAAYTHPFSVTDSGDVSVFLLMSADAANPDNNEVPIGLSLGTWNGVSCAIVIANDNVTPVNSADGTKGRLFGRATSAGNLCVRVYDVGFVPGSSKYELLIDHY